MLRLLPLFAASAMDPLADDILPPGGSSNLFTSNLRDILLISGAALALSLILFLWTYFTRKDRQRQAATQRGARAIYRSERTASPNQSGRRVKIRKRRRDHPENLQRNPTLAEAGGLPPPRFEEPEAPSPSETTQPPQSHAP